jgi:molecular chaperone DnaK
VTYLLGVDLGTTFTAAAVIDEGRAEVIALGNRSSVVPSVVYLRTDGDLLVGEAATRRAMTDPSRVAREFKRRMGDSAPILLGGSPMSPQALMAQVLRWVVDRVSEQLGATPDHIAVSHPANWGPYKLDLFDQTIRLADLPAATTITEPEAAAAYYASVAQLGPGQTVAVYDLGGGTFDAAVVRRTEVGFDILGSPEGIEHLGGIDIDEAVFGHVRGALDGALEELDPDDPNVVAAAVRLRRECVEAKEALSSDVEVSIPVLLPNRHTQVLLTRAELEGMIRPVIGQTIEALRRCLQSASVTPDDIQAVLLVGGSSRIPLVADLVSEELGRPVAVDAHPKHSIVLGTALAAEETVTRSRGAEPVRIDVVAPRPTPPPPAPAPIVGEVPTEPLPQEEAGEDPPAATVERVTHGASRRDGATISTPGPAALGADGSDAGAEDPPVPPSPGDGSDGGSGGAGWQRPAVWGAAAALLLIVAVGVAMLLNGEDPPELADPAAADDPSGEVEEDPAETDDEAMSEEEIEEDEPPADEMVVEPTDDPDYHCDGSLCVVIQDTWIDDDGALTVQWDPIGFEPDVSAWHAHFYWDVYDAEQVGSNAAIHGVEQAPWELTADQPFVAADELELRNRPQEVQGLCATVGDAEHAVIYPQNRHCVALPDGGHLVPFCSDGLCIEMTEIAIQDDELWIAWEPEEFEPDVTGWHAHFYWDVYDAAQVGTNAADLDAEQAPWELTDQTPYVPSGEVAWANRPDDAEGLCVTVADQDHAVVDPTNHHCLPLPETP